VYAGLNLAVCMPLHLWIMRKGKVATASGSRPAREPVIGTIPRERRRAAVLVVSAAFALVSFTLGAMLAHMVPMLGALGLGSAAVVIGSLFGPAQVLSRLINMIFGTRLPPPGLAVVSAALMVVSVLILALSGDWLAGAVAFSVCLGLGSGINSIAQGSLPLYLFGSDGYGALTGKMAAARLVTGAAAPFAFAAAMEQFGIGASLVLSAALGAICILAFIAVAMATKRSLVATPKTSD
ncbi:MAG: arsenite efflux MFS transporter ArsK, partial [Shinella sp.]